MVGKKKKKKPKSKRDQEEKLADPRQEVDAVKGFIFVMVLLTVALGVFILITKGQVSDYEEVLATAEDEALPLAELSRKSREFLKLMKDSEDTTLMNNPERFFGAIYGQQDVGVSGRQVSLDSQNEYKNNREKYTEIFWPIHMDDITREQACLFLWGVEAKSPKAKTIEIRMRRDAKKGEDKWRADFKIGYRIAGTKTSR